MTLHEIGLKHGTDKATFHKFCDFYEKHLDKSKIHQLLEIGVKEGASVKMWRDWVPKALICGVDITEPLAIDNVFTVKLDGTSKEIAELGQFDLVIDDGSHLTEHQIATFELMWPNTNYAYIVEDIHTSFRSDYINGRNAYDYFKDYAKKNKVKLVEFWKDKNDKTDSGTLILFK